jgi:hypothetical protein
MPAVVPKPAAAEPAGGFAPGRPRRRPLLRLRHPCLPGRRETPSPRLPRHPSLPPVRPSRAVPLPAVVAAVAQGPAPPWGRIRSALPPSCGNHTRLYSAARPTAPFAGICTVTVQLPRGRREEGKARRTHRRPRPCSVSLHLLSAYDERPNSGRCPCSTLYLCP